MPTQSVQSLSEGVSGVDSLVEGVTDVDLLDEGLTSVVLLSEGIASVIVEPQGFTSVKLLSEGIATLLLDAGVASLRVINPLPPDLVILSIGLQRILRQSAAGIPHVTLYGTITIYLITESGEYITTESGDRLMEISFG